MKTGPACLEQNTAVSGNTNGISTFDNRPHRTNPPANPGFFEYALNAVYLVFAHLNHRARFLGEKKRERVIYVADINIERTAAGKSHLRKGDDKPAIGAVVVGEREIMRQQFTGRGEKRAKILRVIEIRNLVTHLSEHLGQCRTAEAIFPSYEIDKQKHRFL